MQPGNFLTAFVWGVIPMLILLAIVYFVDRYEKEPLKLLAVALVMGAIIAPLVAVLIEDAVNIRSSAFVSSTIPFTQLTPWTPIIEEVIRGLAILVVFFIVRYEVDDVLDGVVYGAVVGIGFGLAADFWAILQTNSFGQSITPLLPGIMVAGFNHVFYGAVIGLVIATARRAGTANVVLAAIVGMALAAGFHLLHDYLPKWLASGNAAPGQLSGAVSDLPNLLGLAALVGIIVWALGRERVLIGEELHDEVAAGIVTPEDYAAVTHSLRRFGAGTGGGGSRRLRRRLHMLEVELAFRKRMQRSERSRAQKFRSEEEYRQEIVATRNELQGSRGTTGTEEVAP
jgi:RsiW-degrading membrane proteinase PrsW (M82 family)